MTSVASPTRRGVLAGVAVLPVLGPAAAHVRAEDRAEALARRLSELQLPHRPAQLAMLRYADDDLGGEMYIEAVVQLTWAPGIRSRMIQVRAPDFETGLEAVERRAYELFAHPV